MIKLDHVVLAVRDLDEASDRLAAEHGLAALPGGRHDGAGTANRIVPLGDAYLELLAIVDAGAAAASLFGRLVSARLERGEGFAGWCLRTAALDGLAVGLGLEQASASRVRPDGVELRWRLAGVEQAIADPSRPFLIAWDVPPGSHPSAAGPAQGEIVRIEVPTPPAWTAPLPVVVGAAAVVVATARGELRL
jgi:hypothetical protein